MIRKIALALLAAVMLLGMLPTITNAQTTRVSNAPIVFVHGFLLNVCPQTDATSVFASEISVLQGRGYKGKMDPVAYYACDSNGSNIQNSGDPNAYFPGGGNPTVNGAGAYGGVANGNTDNTDIRHISYQLAWYIYNTYSSKGQTVELASHSMGGLISSWMLYQEQIKNPVFPPYLNIQDSVTISTPYDGVNDGYGNISWCPSIYLQCSQLLPGSSFITELDAHGLNAQGTGGTVWTALGGSPCDSVNNPSGTSLDGGNIYKVSFYANTPQAPVCYSHTSYLTDTSTAKDMPVQFRSPGDANVTTIANGGHSLAWATDAIMGIHPASHPDPRTTGIPGVQGVTDSYNSVMQSLSTVHF